MQRVITVVMMVVCGSLTGVARSADAAESKATTPAATSKSPAVGKSAAPSKSAAAKAPPLVAPVAFSLESLESSKVTGAMTDAQVKRAAEAMEKVIGISKGELETTAEFEARRAGALEKPYIGDLTLNDLHGFSIPVRKAERYHSGIGYRYDADTETVEVYLAPKELKPNDIGGPAREASSIEDIRRRMSLPALDEFEIVTDIESRRSYKASNAYGATVTVDAMTAKSVSLGLTRISIPASRGVLVSLAKSNPASTFTLERRVAATELSSLKALLVVKPAAPYLSYHFVHVAATRDSPSEFSNGIRIFRGELVEAVIYSGETGKVFVRMPNVS